jgi:hypothetical protein
MCQCKIGAKDVSIQRKILWVRTRRQPRGDQLAFLKETHFTASPVSENLLPFRIAPIDNGSKPSQTLLVKK